MSFLSIFQGFFLILEETVFSVLSFQLDVVYFVYSDHQEPEHLVADLGDVAVLRPGEPSPEESLLEQPYMVSSVDEYLCRHPALRAEDIGAVLLGRGHFSDQAEYPKPHVGGPGIEEDLPRLSEKLIHPSKRL